MRKINLLQIISFAAQLAIAFVLAVFSTKWIGGSVPPGDFRGLILVCAGFFFLYLYSLTLYRCFLIAFPLRPGEIELGSNQEFVYHVYILYYLLLFYPIMRSGFVPAPLMRLFYLGVGAKLGANTYTQGIIHDPLFVEIGHDSVVGQSALLIPHVIEGSRLAHYAIRVGNNVSIGAGSIVLSDVIIEDGAIVAAGAVVPKGSKIGAGEVWGGIPARCISGASSAMSLEKGSNKKIA